MPASTPPTPARTASSTPPRRLLLLNGPNLNRLGLREPAIYGHTTLAQLTSALQTRAAALGWQLDARQSNHEGELIDWIHAAADDGTQGILINPGAYTHTSIALRDAFASVTLPFIEIHISNVYARESFRQHSLLAPLASGIIVGFGVAGYDIALEQLARTLS